MHHYPLSKSYLNNRAEGGTRAGTHGLHGEPVSASLFRFRFLLSPGAINQGTGNNEFGISSALAIRVIMGRGELLWDGLQWCLCARNRSFFGELLSAFVLLSDSRVALIFLFLANIYIYIIVFHYCEINNNNNRHRRESYTYL
eukprot:gene7247-5095_t